MTGHCLSVVGEVLSIIDTRQMNNSFASISPCGKFVASAGRNIKILTTLNSPEHSISGYVSPNSQNCHWISNLLINQQLTNFISCTVSNVALTNSLGLLTSDQANEVYKINVLF